MAPLRIAFVTGSRSWLRRQGLAAKHAKMRLEGLVYPDVFSLPYFLSDRVHFVRDGARVPRSRFDLIFTELNRSERQLEYIASLVDGPGVPIAVVPGPPELLAQGLTQRKLELVRYILGNAAHVLAYSEAVRSFCDGLLGEPRAVVIPWPFDTQAVAGVRPAALPERATKRILLNVPLRFSGGEQNPFVLKAVLMDVLAELPRSERERFSFHTASYTAEDRAAFTATGFDHGLRVSMERKRGFAAFMRFLAGCDAVINITSGTILGRITFLSAALRRPGIFSKSVELNQALYPNSTVLPLDAERLRALVGGLSHGVASGAVDAMYLPSTDEVDRAGDFKRNAERFRAILFPESGKSRGRVTVDPSPGRDPGGQ